MLGMEIMLAGGFVVGVVAIAYLDRKMMAEAWKGAASSLGFVYREASLFDHPSMAGRHLGVEVLVDVERRGHGKNRRYYTRYRVYFGKHLGLGLWIGREGFFSGVSKFFGSQDIQLGDSSVDSTLMIKGSEPDRVRAFMTRDRRDGAMMLVRRFPDAEIDDEGMLLLVRGVAKKAGTLTSNVDDLVKAALAFRD